MTLTASDASAQVASATSASRDEAQGRRLARWGQLMLQSKRIDERLDFDFWNGINCEREFDQHKHEWCRHDYARAVDDCWWRGGYVGLCTVREKNSIGLRSAMEGWGIHAIPLKTMSSL